jgi:hypothetical protein
VQDALAFDAVREPVLDLVLPHGRHHCSEERSGVVGRLQKGGDVDHECYPQPLCMVL